MAENTHPSISAHTVYVVAKDLLERADAPDVIDRRGRTDCAFEALGILQAFVAGYRPDQQEEA